MHRKEKSTPLQRVHMIGIGGIGMSALARHFLHEKKIVSGSDRSLSLITDALQREGVLIRERQTPENITDDIDLVVYTEAVAKDDEELVEARKKDIKTMNYFEALGMVANEYYLIAVAGSHGKTTTTAMLIDIFEKAGFDPSAVVGSLRARTKSNYRRGKSKYFIVEACEYRRDFLSLSPDVLVITNIEHEHVDYYKDLRAVQNAFREFAKQVRDTGVIVANTGDPRVLPVIEGLERRVVDYRSCIDLNLPLTVPGLHNKMNAAAALAVSICEGITKEDAYEALEAFSGTWRRFEYKGMVGASPLYDDYGHHPTEIRATLLGAKERFPKKEIVLIFEPHMYSRSAELFNDFVDALSLADVVGVMPIYAAREENTSGISHEQMVDALRKKEKNVTALSSFKDAHDFAKRESDRERILLTMGAGSIYKVANSLTNN